MGRAAASPNVLEPSHHTQEDFSRRVCLPFLVRAQAADGGWGYRPQQASAIEPTAWCLLALGKAVGPADALDRGQKWLAAVQNADGSWPTRPHTVQGNWVTALAGLAQAATRGPEERIARAARWVCESRPAEGALWMRLAKLVTSKRAAEQDDSLHGWSWTPGTASWVEPTAVALIFLAEFAPQELRARAAERRRMGEAMLYNRMCPSGGWNSGNPKVYGVPGIPQAGPTAWALIALQDHEEREENRRSLDWLESNYDSIAGVSSLALATIALEASGRAAPSVEPRLSAMAEAEVFFDDVIGYAQASFALGAGPDVLRRPRTKI